MNDILLVEEAEEASSAQTDDPVRSRKSSDEKTPTVSKTPEATVAQMAQSPAAVGETQHGVHQAPRAEDFDLAPEALKITRKELAFMAALDTLIPTPRAAKRFGNIYRLIRAGIPQTQLSGFLGDENVAGQYAEVLVLLAIQVGFPFVAKDLFSAMRSDAKLSWAEIRGKLNPNDKSAEKRDGRLSTWSDLPRLASSRDIRRVTACLDALLSQQKIGSSTDRDPEWIDLVSRYSFREAEHD
jgi:hypothetical protein